MLARITSVAVTLAALAAGLPAHAATAYSALRYTVDSAVATNGTTITQRDVAIDNLAGTTTRANLGTLAPEATIIGYHFVVTTNVHWLVFGTTVGLPGGVTAGPRDVVAWNGTNYSKLFDGAAASLPDGASIAAIASRDGTEILMVIDTVAVLSPGGITATPRNVVRFNAGTWSELATEASLAAPPEAQIDGLDILANGHLLVSFDVSGAVGSVNFHDDDILEFTPGANTWEISRSLRNGNAAFEGVDVKDFFAFPQLAPTDDTDSDGVPNGVETTEGLNPFVKDNDVFANNRLFAMQQYRDFLGREAAENEIQYYADLITNGQATRANIIESFFNSPEFSGTASPIVRLYFAFFLRIPDYPGLIFQIEAYRSGTPLAVIANNFAQSPEFLATYGSLDNPAYVSLLYQNVLQRTASQAEIDYHVNRLNMGATRGEVMLGFSESPEFISNTTNDVFVVMMYVGMLHRSPEQAGFDFWVDYMDQGNSGLALIMGFLNAPEYHDRFLP